MIYLLRLPTYSLLIVASTLAYFFFSGARAFAMIYFPPHYGLAAQHRQRARYCSRRWRARGFTGRRTNIAASSRQRQHQRPHRRAGDCTVSFGAVPCDRHLAVDPVDRVPVLMVGTGLLSAALAPIDAARLDIIHPRLWGRGEAGRMALRAGFEGGAPLLFGAMSVWLGGGTSGLMWTLLIMLIPMLIAGSLVVPGLRTYPRDVATAAASVRATAKSSNPSRRSLALGKRATAAAHWPMRVQRP